MAISFMAVNSWRHYERRLDELGRVDQVDGVDGENILPAIT